MRRILETLVSLLLLLSSERLLGQNKLVANLSLFYFDQAAVRNVQVNSVDTSVKTETTYTFLSLGLCYAWDAFCLGVKYVQDDIENKVSSSRGGTTVTTRLKGLGLSVGYTSDTLVAQGVYLLDGSKTIDEQDLSDFGGTGTGTLVYPAKSGYVIEIGYGFKIASVRVGPLLTITNFTYKKVKVEGQSIELSAQEKDDFIVPQLGLWLDI